MPNFKTKYIKKLNLPIVIEGVKFEFSTEEQRGKTLVYTSIKNKSFFIQINNKPNEFVVKIDKLTKITDLALMQQALRIFEEHFCKDIISRAYHYNENKELANNIINNIDDLKTYINNKDNVYLEIGFGSGRHLLYQAKNNPNNTYIGIEIHKPSLIQVSKLAKDVDNLKLLDFDARIVMKELKENSLSGIYLHFPVPWDDAPYRRVVSSEFKDEVVRTLKINGFFELRSDSPMYANYTKDVFSEYDYDFIKNKNARIVSKYEDRWLRQNKDIYDFIIHKTNNVKINSSEKSSDVGFIIDHNKLGLIKYIGDDYFVKISRIYNDKTNKIISLAYGNFDTPSSSYILSKENEKFEFLFFRFCPTVHNIKAFNKLKELLK